jgi:hypothetical protein
MSDTLIIIGAKVFAVAVSLYTVIRILPPLLRYAHRCLTEDL